MARKLIVTHAFGDRQVGDEITDPSEVSAVLETHRHAVVPVEVDDPPPRAVAAPAPSPAPDSKS